MLCTYVSNASNILTATIGTVKCPKIKHGWCSNNKVSATYNWKTGRGKISYDYAVDNEGVSIRLVGYDADGMYLGTISEATIEVGYTGYEFNELGNELDAELRKDVRKLKLIPDDGFHYYTTGCNDNYDETDDGKCVKSKKLPDNCWGDPNGTSYCNYN